MDFENDSKIDILSENYDVMREYKTSGIRGHIIDDFASQYSHGTAGQLYTEMK